MTAIQRLVVGFGLMFLVVVGVIIGMSTTHAQNIASYSDTISNSRPEASANHTFRFRPRIDIPPGGVIRLDFPADFTVATDDFSERNIEMFVDNTPRTSAASVGANTDGVTISPGAGGVIEYELHAGLGIPAEASVELRVGNHTSDSILTETTFSTTTGTTTNYLDAPPYSKQRQCRHAQDTNDHYWCSRDRSS